MSFDTAVLVISQSFSGYIFKNTEQITKEKTFSKQLNIKYKSLLRIKYLGRKGEGNNVWKNRGTKSIALHRKAISARWPTQKPGDNTASIELAAIPLPPISRRDVQSVLIFLSRRPWLPSRKTIYINISQRLKRNLL